MGFYENIVEYPPLTLDEEHVLIRQAQADDMDARDELLERHIPLVRSIATLYAVDGVLAEELICDGIIGLNESIANFNFDFKVRLSTYAYRYIQGAICDSDLLARQVDAPSRWRFKTLPDYRAAVEELKDRGVAPTTMAVADQLNVSPEVVENIVLIAERSYISLYQEADGVDDDHTRLVIDTIGEEDREVQQLEQRDLLEFFVSKLDPTERRIVEGWFGIYEKFTLVELSEQLGIERRKVATIRDFAVDKLKVLAKMDNARDHLTKEERDILDGTTTFASKRELHAIDARLSEL